jgi:hypothetical protein
MKRDKGGENDDLLAYVKAGAHKVGQATDVPSPVGRNMAGWAPVQIKLQPEAVVMLDQLREHPFFRGLWKTQSQVAWSMVYLGLQSVTNFLQEDWHGWRKFKSNALVYTNAAVEHQRLTREETLKAAASMYRRTIHQWLDKDTDFGKYMAWKALDSAIQSREVAEDVRGFDAIMVTPDRGVRLDSPLVFDNRAGDLYRKLVPNNGCPVDEAAHAATYTEMTEQYFMSLDSERGAEAEDDGFEV